MNSMIMIGIDLIAIAVLALAAASNVNVTFVVAAQVLRVFLMLLVVPLFTRARGR